MEIELNEIVYDIRARNGAWCMLPYPGHKKGCPNFPKCPQRYLDFNEIKAKRWIAILVEFDLKRHMELMKNAHPDWTEQQCRNLLYWQGKVRAALRKGCLEFSDHNVFGLHRDIILEIPEASGINVFETMAKVGITIDRHPLIVKKVMLVGVL